MKNWAKKRSTTSSTKTATLTATTTAARSAALEKLTIDDVKKFYRDHYTQANFVLGLAGGYPKGFDEKVQRDFAAKLPAGSAAKLQPAAACRKSAAWRCKSSRRTRPGTAISFGFPSAGDARGCGLAGAAGDAVLLRAASLASSYLYQRLREIRGLELRRLCLHRILSARHVPVSSRPESGAASSRSFRYGFGRSSRQNGLFALRAGLYEVEQAGARRHVGKGF